MNDQIDQMVSPHTEFSEMVIQSKTVIRNKTGLAEMPEGLHIIQIPDFSIVDDVIYIVEL